MTRYFHLKTAFLALAFALAFCGSAFAQEETAATVSGQVTDSTGAIVSGATVVITNDATRQERRLQTNQDGQFVITPLVPGTYTLTVEQTNFKKYVESGLTLNAKDRRLINVVLEVGNVSEQVTVVSETNVVQDTPTGQTLISGTQVLEIPLQNRDFTKLLELAPGVSSSLDDETGFGTSNRFDVSINGMRRNGVNVFVDGVSNTDVGSNITLLSIPTIDSIKEFKVLTSNYTADVGRSGGGTVTIVTKSGGNDFHGSIYDFARNNRFNANTFFNNRRGRNAAGDPLAPTPRLRYHNFGGTFSGPVTLPMFGEGGRATWSGKDKTFFFFSEEQRRITRGITEAIATVPSVAERGGNFSSSLGALLFRTNAGTGSCTTPGAGTCSSTPLFVTDTNGNSIQARAGMVFRPTDGRAYIGNIIPQSDFSPIALSLLTAYPLPNSGVSGFVFSPVNGLKTRQETIRIDHNINDNNRLFGRYTHDLDITEEPGGLFANTNLPNVTTTDTRIPGQTLAISMTDVLSPTLVNEATYNFSSNLIGSNVVGRSRLSDFGGLNIPQVFPENNAEVIPQISFTSAVANINSLQGFNIVYKNNVARDVVTWVHGNHTLKFGGEMSWESKDENANNITQGLFSFAGTRSRGTSGTISLTQTGIALADFLLGRADSYSEDQFDVTVNLRFGRREFFAQDTWKLRPNFTFDYGVRYQYFTPVTDKNNVLTSFDPALYNAGQVPTCRTAACASLIRGTGNELNGIAVAGSTSRFGNAISPSDKNNFSPRVGFSWDPWKNGKTVVRAGYGLYYDQVLVGIFEQNAFVNPPFNNRATFSGAAVTFSNPSGGTLGDLPVRDLIASAPDFQTPMIQQWSLGIQREIFRNMVAEISYVGTKGDHLIRPIDINYPSPADVNRVGLANANTVRPFLGYRRIQWRETSAKSRYHGMLSALTYRFASGVSLTAAYTFSKNLTDASNDRDAVDFPQDPRNYRPEYAEARTSRPHIFSASYVYELPFFRKDPNGWKRGILGGWQFAGITDIESGQPVARVVSGASNVAAVIGQYPNVVSDPNAGLAGTTDPVTGLPYIFDPHAFVAPTNGTYGNAPRAFARLFGRNQTNLTLTKNIYFDNEQRTKLQLRVEAFNVFNHTQFTGAGTTLTTTSTFGLPTGTRLPREFQFGAKISF
ncbi:MAG TPA: carboxypeptidase regulatory-like domain-containing protein [Pyrinomonadaceae bacterium]|nr:carboxypeptidase regulatory-like domain-containing protein [Pyrinomonadaceae bacterium]